MFATPNPMTNQRQRKLVLVAESLIDPMNAKHSGKKCADFYSLQKAEQNLDCLDSIDLPLDLPVDFVRVDYGTFCDCLLLTVVIVTVYYFHPNYIRPGFLVTMALLMFHPMNV